jgi:alpha-beta hydrolase superfamily lysophospholipase
MTSSNTAARPKPQPRVWRTLARPILRALGAALAVYAGLLALLWWGQERLLFVPTVLPANHRFNVPAVVHETWVDVPGGRLHALHLKQPQSRGVVFYLHGNAGNLQSWFVNADFYRQAQLDLFMIDYRGYGKSPGRITSQAQLLADVRAAWDQISPAYAGKKRVVFGRSLGTGLAALLAAEVQPELTVLVSPYFSMQALAAEHYPWVPGALLRYPLRTDLALPRIQGPVWMVHGARDTLIPLSHAQRLLAASPRAKLQVLPEAGHNNLQDVADYSKGLLEALQMP